MEQRPNIKALLALVHTAQMGSMTRGAERLGMNQSAVSHYIGDLETFIGEALFERSHQGVIPTQLGEQLCGQALTVLEALDRFTEVANGELLSPPIKILSFPRLADTLLVH